MVPGIENQKWIESGLRGSVNVAIEVSGQEVCQSLTIMF